MISHGNKTTLSKASLLGLPPEVREKILEYIFPARLLVWTQKGTTMRHPSRIRYYEFMRKPAWWGDLAILHTCKKLHDEALSVYRSSMSLLVPTPMTPKLLAAFKPPSGISQNIQSLQLTLTHDPFDLSMFPSLRMLSLKHHLGYKRGWCTDDDTLLRELDESNDQQLKQDCMRFLLTLRWLESILDRRNRPFKLRIMTVKGFAYFLEHR